MLNHTLFFDLDDTLYPKSNGLWNAIRDRMHAFMAEIVALPPAEIEALRQYYLVTYGTTLRGLQIHYHVDADKYLEYVHDLPLAEFIFPDPKLGELLASLPQRKVIFTNADIHHARRVLAVLQLGDCFEQIIDIRALGFVCKPDAAAYPLALKLAGATDPQKCILFDDAPRNLAPAMAQGWYTVLIGPPGTDASARQIISNLHELPKVMPQLWDHQRSYLEASRIVDE